MSATDGKSKRVVSGMRPTGRLHIGHYFGALQNWIASRTIRIRLLLLHRRLARAHQRLRRYLPVAENTIEIVTDYLAAGLDPKKSRHLPAVADPRTCRTAPFALDGHTAQLARARPHLQRSIRKRHEQGPPHIRLPRLPVLQTADIVVYSKIRHALFVPVGEDQVSHVELSREIVRRFNSVWLSTCTRERKRVARSVLEAL